MAERRIFQAGGRASAKALGQKRAWCVCRTSWRLVWLDERAVGADEVRVLT